MKKKYRNSSSTRYNINYKNVDKSFIKDLVIFGKNHIRQKLNGFRFFIKLFTCILLIWTWKHSQNTSTFDTHGNSIKIITYRTLNVRHFRVLSKAKGKKKVECTNSTKNVADLLELDENTIEAQYESLKSSSFNENSLLFKLCGKCAPPLLKFFSKINKAIELEVILALKNDTSKNDSNSDITKTHKWKKFGNFFFKYKIFSPLILHIAGLFVSISFKEIISAVVLVVLLVLIIIYFFNKIKECTRIMEMHRKSRDMYIGFMDYY